MPRLALHFAISCLTFLVGSAIAVSYRSLTTVDTFESPPVMESNEITIVSVGPQPELKVRGLMHACGPKANFHTYVASDGAGLASSCVEMASARRAAQELKKKLAKATEILERHEQLNEYNVVVGKRVVVANADGVASYSTIGKSFCETSAPSLKHLKALRGY